MGGAPAPQNAIQSLQKVVDIMVDETLLHLLDVMKQKVLCLDKVLLLHRRHKAQVFLLDLLVDQGQKPPGNDLIAGPGVVVQPQQGLVAQHLQGDRWKAESSSA